MECNADVAQFLVLLLQKWRNNGEAPGQRSVERGLLSAPPPPGWRRMGQVSPSRRNAARLHGANWRFDGRPRDMHDPLDRAEELARPDRSLGALLAVDSAQHGYGQNDSTAVIAAAQSYVDASKMSTL